MTVFQQFNISNAFLPANAQKSLNKICNILIVIISWNVNIHLKSIVIYVYTLVLILLCIKINLLMTLISSFLFNTFLLLQIRRLIWALLLTISLGFLIYNTTQQIINYFNYDHVTKYDITFVHELGRYKCDNIV